MLLKARQVKVFLSPSNIHIIILSQVLKKISQKEKYEIVFERNI